MTTASRFWITAFSVKDCLEVVKAVASQELGENPEIYVRTVQNRAPEFLEWIDRSIAGNDKPIPLS